MSEALTIKFWGVRGSHPVAGPGTVQFGGNTPCVEINAGEQVIILDAGTGIIGLGRDLLRRARQANKPVRAALFFSHLHHDHTQGYPFFAPAFVPSTRLELFGPGIFDQTLEEALSHVLTPPVFPLRLADQAAVKSFYNIHESNIVILSGEKTTITDSASASAQDSSDATRVRLLRSSAHPGGVANYRLDWRGLSVVYATDIEGYVDTDRRLAAFARGADVLIHDAQYSDEHYCGLAAGLPATQGWGHSTARMAAGVAQAAQVGQLVLFHHEPGYNDEILKGIESKAAQHFASTRAAFEGLEIRLAVPASPHSAVQSGLRQRAPRPTRVQPHMPAAGR